MQLHEKDLAMSPNFRDFWKTNYSYLTDTNYPPENIVSMFTNSEEATESYSLKQDVPLLLSISLKNSFGRIFNKVAGWRLATLVKVRSFTDIFQGISLQVQNNYMVTPVCRTPLDGCFSRLYSGVMPKKGITKKFVEVFTKDRNSSSKVTTSLDC